MILKTLVTGMAAAAVVAAAAGGVTTIASSAPSATPMIQQVVWDIPLPDAPAPDLQGPLTNTVNALGSGGSFDSKTPYIEPLGVGLGSAAKRGYNDAVKKGYFPLTAAVTNVDLNGPVATANVIATTANGGTAPPTLLTFAASPSSPTGWVLTKGSLLSLSSALG